MDLNGLYLIGKFEKWGPFQTRDGRTFDGFFEVEVDRGTQWPMRAQFNAEDRDTGETTAIFRQLKDEAPSKGERIAVKVATKRSGEFVNLEAMALVLLDRADAQH